MIPTCVSPAFRACVARVVNRNVHASFIPSTVAPVSFMKRAVAAISSSVRRRSVTRPSPFRTFSQ